MDEDKLLEKIINKELTICETCDSIFTYIPQKVFCDECNRDKLSARVKARREKNKQDPEWVAKESARKRAHREKNKQDPEWVAKESARVKARYEKNKQDPEWVAKESAQNKARYHAKKKKNASK